MDHYISLVPFDFNKRKTIMVLFRNSSLDFVVICVYFLVPQFSPSQTLQTDLVHVIYPLRICPFQKQKQKRVVCAEWTADGFPVILVRTF